MIFVTVGTNEARFDRLLEAIDALEVDERIVAQCGSSPVRPRGAECREFLAFDEVVELVKEARVVVSHAGVGSVLVALANGKLPVVVPRLRRFGEAVDDHQRAFARRLHAAGLVVCVERPHLLEGALAVAQAAPVRAAAGSELADDLHRYLVERGRGAYA